MKKRTHLKDAFRHEITLSASETRNDDEAVSARHIQRGGTTKQQLNQRDCGSKGIFEMGSRSGQSLIEVLMGLAIGALLIGAASIAIAFILRSGSTVQTINTATQFSQDLLNKVKTFSASNWGNVYNLQRSTSTINPYFLVASGAGFIATPGEEGVIDNEIKNGLVGRWGFDEETGTITYDESGNGNNGSLVNNPTWQSASTCKESYCLYFNGGYNNTGSSVNVGRNTLFDSSSFSIVFWVKPIALGAGDQNGNIIVGRESYLVSGFRMGFRTSGQPVFWTTQSGGSLSLISALPVSINAFSQVAVTYASSTAVIYVNGNTGCSATGNYVTPTGVNLIIHGGIGGTTTTPDYLDDVRIYNRVLSADEIKQLYNGSVFRRYFSVRDVCRNTNGTLDASTTPPCTSNLNDFNDPSTQAVTAVTEWDAAGKTSNFSLSDYFTRWSNFTFNQSDWSGGTNTTGVFSVPSNQYASATNITTSNPLGSIQIQNLTQ